MSGIQLNRSHSNWVSANYPASQALWNQTADSANPFVRIVQKIWTAVQFFFTFSLETARYGVHLSVRLFDRAVSWAVGNNLSREQSPRVNPDLQKEAEGSSPLPLGTASKKGAPLKEWKGKKKDSRVSQPLFPSLENSEPPPVEKESRSKIRQKNRGKGAPSKEKETKTDSLSKEKMDALFKELFPGSPQSEKSSPSSVEPPENKPAKEVEKKKEKPLRLADLFSQVKNTALKTKASAVDHFGTIGVGFLSGLAAFYTAQFYGSTFFESLSWGALAAGIGPLGQAFFEEKVGLTPLKAGFGVATAGSIAAAWMASSRKVSGFEAGWISFVWGIALQYAAGRI